MKKQFYPNHSAFTMIELIFVIVIIGILASVAIPKFMGIKDNAKKTAEIATMSAVSTAIDGAHGEWSINEGNFVWGNNQNSATHPLNSVGYPDDLSANGHTFGALLKSSTDSDKFKLQANKSSSDYNISIFTGPASNPQNGVKYDKSAKNSDIPGRPDKNDYWIYASYINPNKTCKEDYSNKILHSGDILLIDINGTTPTNYNNISITCN